MKDGERSEKPHHGHLPGCLYQTAQIVFLKSKLTGFICNQRKYPWVCQFSSGIAFTGNVGLGICEVIQTLGSQGSSMLPSCAGCCCGGWQVGGSRGKQKAIS